MGRRGRALSLPHWPSLPTCGGGASEERLVREPGLCQREEKQSNMGGGVKEAIIPGKRGGSPLQQRPENFESFSTLARGNELIRNQHLAES